MTQPSTYGKRLLKLRDHLKTLKPEQYRHVLYVTSYDGHPCGTVACAFGHAVASRIFHGLRHLAITHGKAEKGVCPYLFKKTKYGDRDISVRNEAENFFGPGAIDLIFGLSAYGNVRQPVLTDVIKRIEVVVASAEYSNKH